MEVSEKKNTQEVINQRFGELVNFFKKSGRIKNESRFAASISASQAQVNRLAKFEGGNASSEMVSETLNMYPDVNPKWLLALVDGPMFLEGNAKGLGAPFETDFVDVPFVRVALRATFTECILTHTQPEIETIRVMYVNPKLYSKGVVFEIDGDSMEPNYVPGARVLAVPVDPSNWQYINSGVYAICFSSSFVIKRVKDNQLIREGFLTLHSDNPSGGSLPVRLSDIQAVWKIEQIVYSPAR